MKYQEQYDAQRQIWYRPGTNDTWIYDEIEKDYRLGREQFNSNEIAMDIGSHAGYFTKKLVEMGIGHVYLFEPQPDNLVLCSKNLENYKDKIEISEKAVWNKSNETLFINELGVNSGGNSVLSTGPIAVKSISFDEIIEKATNNFKNRIKILKIDTEGSEWPILFTSKYLGFIDIIVGEVHEFGKNGRIVPDSLKSLGLSNFTIEEFKRFIVLKGFSFAVTQNTGFYYIPFKAKNRRQGVNDHRRGR